MSLLASVALVVVGLVLVVASAEKLVEGLVDTSRGFGVSAFVLSVVFLGFDPENLAVGAAGTWEGVAGFALGSIIGAYMVAVALAFGVTALVAPMEIRAPKPILALVVLLVGSEMLVRGGHALLGQYGLSTTFFGMTALALLVSVEELARELPAAWKGRSPPVDSSSTPATKTSRRDPLRGRPPCPSRAAALHETPQRR